MTPLIAMILLAMPVALQAAQAQGGAVDAQAAEELRRIGDSVASLDRGSWLAFWGSFLIGIAIVVAAIVSSWRYARHLSRQVRQAADHFKVVEKDLRVRKRPRLSWTGWKVEADPESDEQTVSVAITNVGDVSATGMSAHVVFGMADGPEGLEGRQGDKIQVGAMPPNTTRVFTMPVSGREKEDEGTSHRFRFRITLRYRGAGGARYEYGLVGELVGCEVLITEPGVEAGS